MIVKVCGMRDEQNLLDVEALGVDLIGFIFYEPSPRYVGDSTPKSSDSVGRVGVFVNSTIEKITKRVKECRLDYVQLHGVESEEFCRQVRELGVKVIKAISIAHSKDMEQAMNYSGVVDYMLFDTKCAGYGGSGERFDWSILDLYKGSAPFLLSGGIDEDMAADIASISHTQFTGVDLNSRFEVLPGFKNIEKLKRIIDKLKNE